MITRSKVDNGKHPLRAILLASRGNQVTRIGLRAIKELTSIFVQCVCTRVHSSGHLGTLGNTQSHLTANSMNDTLAWLNCQPESGKLDIGFATNVPEQIARWLGQMVWRIKELRDVYDEGIFC